MLILVPYFGDLDRFHPLAKKWTAAHLASGTKADFHFICPWDTTWKTKLPYELDVTQFSDLIRPDQPFDIKGALVCAALLHYEESLLVLDVDAFLARDPEPALLQYGAAPIAMPPDDGAVAYYRSGSLSSPFAHVRKLCAGVMWFGAPVVYGTSGATSRGILVAHYRNAYLDLVGLPSLPWEQQLPHLVEQYAWSIVTERIGGAVLPRSMNWNPDLLGHSDGAIINHHYGLRKWRENPNKTKSSY